MKISQFNMFIKKTKPMLESFLSQAKTIKNAKHHFQCQFDMFNRIMMVEYEKNCISEYCKDDVYDQLNEQNANLMPVSQYNGNSELGVDSNINNNNNNNGNTTNSNINESVVMGQTGNVLS